MPSLNPLHWTHKDYRYPPLSPAIRKMLDDRAAASRFSWEQDAERIKQLEAQVAALKEKLND